MSDLFRCFWKLEFLSRDDMRAAWWFACSRRAPTMWCTLGDTSLTIAREVKLEEEDVSIPLTPMLSNAGFGGDSAKTVVRSTVLFQYAQIWS